MAYQLIVFGHFVADRSERTASRHAEAFLQFDLSKKPSFQIHPGTEFVFHERRAAFDGFQMHLKHFVNEAFLAPEIVIELALACPGSLDNLVRACCANSLFVKEVGGNPDDPKSCLRSPCKPGSHNLLHMYL